MALALGVLLRVFSSGTQLAVVSDEYTHAVLLAESQLATVGMEESLEQGEETGTFEDRYRWTISVQPYEQQEQDEIDLNVFSLTPYQVQVNVEWGEAGQQRSVELTTLRLGKKR